LRCNKPLAARLRATEIAPDRDGCTPWSGPIRAEPEYLHDDYFTSRDFTDNPMLATLVLGSAN
jgi:hypothetical protein